jgi:ribosome-binding factor A
MSPDMRLATAYVMPLGGRDTGTVLQALERNRRFIKGEIARRINLRYAPEIRFREDQTFAEASRIEALLHSERVRRDLEPSPNADDDGNDDL